MCQLFLLVRSSADADCVILIAYSQEKVRKYRKIGKASTAELNRFISQIMTQMVKFEISPCQDFAFFEMRAEGSA